MKKYGVELTQHHRAIYDTEANISSLRWFKQMKELELQIIKTLIKTV